HSPCNLAWRGRLLENALALSGARVAIVHAELLPRLAEVDLHALRDVIVVGETDTTLPGVQLHSAAILEQHEPAPAPEPALQAWDDRQLIFSSGTPGASSGAVCPYAHMASFMGETLPEHFGERETFLCVLPLFHAGGAGSIYEQLRRGGAIVLP